MSDLVDKALLQNLIQKVLKERQRSRRLDETDRRIITKAVPIVEKKQSVTIEAEQVVLNVKELILNINMTVEPQVNVEIPAAPTVRTRKIIERSEDGKLAAIVEELIPEKGNE